MRVIASINMTLDGFCDHTHGIPDEQLHDHYTEMLQGAGALIYGRTTYQMMESYWPTLVKTPSGKRSMDDFAMAMENIHKIVFSRTLQKVDWTNARLATKDLREEVIQLRQQPGKPVYAGSPSMIVGLTNLNLVDEYHLAVHPVIAGSSLPLFKNITEKITLKLVKTKTFHSGVVVHYYEK